MLDPDYTVNYFSLMFTFKVASVKGPFFGTYKSTRCRYEKAILYPRNQSNGSTSCTPPEQDSGKQNLSQNLGMSSGPPFIAQYNCGKGREVICKFMIACIFKGRRNLKNLRHVLVA